MEKVLTVIIPTYNMEKYLDKCLTSLIVEEEKMDSLEVLVINDGSKDGSSKIAHGYESRYPGTFRVIDKENGNYGSCVNRGLTEAKGKYIKILDADDYFDTGVLFDYLTALGEVDVDFVFNGMSMVNEDGGVVGDYCFESALGDTSSMTIEEYASRMNGVGLYMQNVAYKTECLKRMGYVQTEGISYTDQEWLFVPLFVTKSVAYFQKPIYQYLIGRAGQTVDSSVHLKNMWMEVEVTKSMIGSYSERIKDVSSERVVRYIQGRMMSRIRYVYSSFLLSYSGLLSNADLVEFDKNLLKMNSNLYQMAGMIKARFGIRYVRIWRRSYSDRTVLFRLVRLKHALFSEGE